MGRANSLSRSASCRLRGSLHVPLLVLLKALGGGHLPFVVDAEARQSGDGVSLLEFLQANHTLTSILAQHIVCTEHNTGTVLTHGTVQTSGAHGTLQTVLTVDEETVFSHNTMQTVLTVNEETAHSTLQNVVTHGTVQTVLTVDEETGVYTWHSADCFLGINETG